MQQVTNIKELEHAINTNGEMIVTKNSKNNMILLSFEEYKKKLWNDNEIDEKLLKAEKQIDEGKTVKATEVFKELEEIIWIFKKIENKRGTVWENSNKDKIFLIDFFKNFIVVEETIFKELIYI